mmetsp:Transcript_3767/g.5144  ORF Transcript_3767/g.5144 Transcript_3767/m.5144 type:complete len:146 (-) Transcript_3767:596-1033(-)|eukprot:CAMPEP_0116058572 /NCGR_PEP_ID=MMETSP0322-20121206/5274_1 /TAXON_ID=163516 /ORGANISM="Leptocylindrus danicus var. apora, Strain B651" /LENGTH=145 /DNA_ID=CAMNT_0003542775 /DNA_START=58 /DNA_END=495 /DNA_ORIENTATION=+
MSVSSSSVLFIIVGKNEPLYEAEFNKLPGGVVGGGSNSDMLRQSYFVLHSSLDLVEKSSWTNPSMNLKVVDKVNQQIVSAFLTAGGIRFLALHYGKSDDSLKSFFMEVYELYTKLLMNPFYSYDTPILSKAFDKRVRHAARRYLS